MGLKRWVIEYDACVAVKAWNGNDYIDDGIN